MCCPIQPRFGTNKGLNSFLCQGLLLTWTTLCRSKQSWQPPGTPNVANKCRGQHQTCLHEQCCIHGNIDTLIAKLYCWTFSLWLNQATISVGQKPIITHTERGRERERETDIHVGPIMTLRACITGWGVHSLFSPFPSSPGRRSCGSSSFKIYLHFS